MKCDGKRGDLKDLRVGIDMSVLIHGAIATESIAVAQVIDGEPCASAERQRRKRKPKRPRA